MFGRPHLNHWLGTVVHTYHPSYVGSINRRITVQAGSTIKQDPLSSPEKLGG
jgi:hypothetical protein